MRANKRNVIVNKLLLHIFLCDNVNVSHQLKHVLYLKHGVPLNMLKNCDTTMKANAAEMGVNKDEQY